jgi:hypothetical protein
MPHPFRVGLLIWFSVYRRDYTPYDAFYHALYFITSYFCVIYPAKKRFFTLKNGHFELREVKNMDKNNGQ